MKGHNVCRRQNSRSIYDLKSNVVSIMIKQNRREQSACLSGLLHNRVRHSLLPKLFTHQFCGDQRKRHQFRRKLFRALPTYIDSLFLNTFRLYIPAHTNVLKFLLNNKSLTALYMNKTRDWKKRSLYTLLQ